MSPSMSPIQKITNPISEDQHISEFIKCPYCNNNHCWKHGTYTRKGFHSQTPQNGWILRTVQRFLCRDVSCKQTFSLLPEDVLPYCRFFYSDLLSIIHQFNQGMTAYSIAHKHWKLSLRIILRIKRLIHIVYIYLEQLCREFSIRIGGSFSNMVFSLSQRLSWFRFTRIWFHHIYPCRIKKNLNPHNLGIKCP